MENGTSCLAVHIARPAPLVYRPAGRKQSDQLVFHKILSPVWWIPRWWHQLECCSFRAVPYAIRAPMGHKKNHEFPSHLPYLPSGMQMPWQKKRTTSKNGKHSFISDDPNQNSDLAPASPGSCWCANDFNLRAWKGDTGLTMIRRDS